MAFWSKSLPSPTREEEQRWDKLREYGCICCRRRLGIFEPCEIHHLLIGSRRAGHRFTIGLCPWHHRGVADPPISSTRGLRGPSLMDGSKAFHITFGSDAELLAANDRAIKCEGVAWPTSKQLQRAVA